MSIPCIQFFSGKPPTFCTDSLEPENERALLLTLNTEVIIAPKTRQVASTAKHDLNEMSPSPASAAFPSSLRRQLFRLLPLDLIEPFGLPPATSRDEDVPTALVHPVLYASLTQAVPSAKVGLSWVPQPQQHGLGDKDKDREKEKKDKHKPKETDDESERKIVVRLERDRQIPKGHVWLAEKGRSKLGLKEGNVWELVR
jgi:hypothetical protein